MRIFPLFIPHAGCRRRCIYCNQKAASRQAGGPDPKDIVKSIAMALEHGALDEVAYYGGSFTALPVSRQTELLDVLQPFRLSGKIGGIRLSTRPDALDRETVERLLAAGVKTVELGCQSFSSSVLEASRRDHTAADAVRAASLLRAANMRCGIQLMPGLPHGDRAEALDSLTAALRLEPDFLRIYPTVVLVETELAALWRKGHYTPLDLDQAIELCVEMSIICERIGVPVIRYGLQANECLESGSVLAGPYHPAFGQLVKSRRWHKALNRLVGTGISEFSVHPSDLSDALGHRRCNLAAFDKISVHAQRGIRRGFVGVGSEAMPLLSLLSGGGEEARP